jgi:hypothetical protein
MANAVKEQQGEGKRAVVGLGGQYLGVAKK